MDARPERAGGEANGSGPRPIAWAVCIATLRLPESPIIPQSTRGQLQCLYDLTCRGHDCGLVSAGFAASALSTVSTRLRFSAGLSGRWRDLGSGAVRRGLPINELGDAQQQVTIGLGGDRITEALVRPVECTDAAFFVVAERSLAADADARSGTTSCRPRRFDSHCTRCASWPASTSTG